MGACYGACYLWVVDVLLEAMQAIAQEAISFQIFTFIVSCDSIIDFLANSYLYIYT